MEKEEILDINGKRRIWERLKEIEFKQSLIEGLSKHNSELAISQLKDFENGINCTTPGRRLPSSLLKIRGAYRKLSKRIGKKEDIDKISKDKLTKIVIKENLEEFAKEIKVIFNWMKRAGIIKENPAEHILTKDFSSGKPGWVYLGEEGMKLLINSLGSKHKALTYLLFDAGIRPEEAWRLRVYDFQDDFKVLDIPEKRTNGERVAKKNSFGRKIKLKLCSELIKEFVKIENLKLNDTLFNMTQAGYNKALRLIAKKLFGSEPTKARESPDKITAYDIRHNSACFWLKRYKTNKDLMYRFGWKSEDKVFHYTEFLDMRDTIDDEDLLTKEDKTRMETEMKDMNDKINYIKEELMRLKRKNNQDFIVAV